jgi:hypothetical protein
MWGSKPSLAEVQAAFPGTNFIRLAIYNYDSPQTLAAYVNPFAAAGIVVEIEDHFNDTPNNAGGSQGTVFTGAKLDKELAWFSAIGKEFAGNPYIWFGTNNEPATNPSAAALSAWQRQTVQAVRKAGNTNPVMVEMNCDAVNECGLGYDASAYRDLSNIIWDLHYYNWLSNMSTDQAAISALITRYGKSAQKITSADGVVPVLIGEFGNSTTGIAIDPGAVEAVAAVVSSGTKGEFGSAAWAWGSGNPGDGLTDSNGQPSNPYGMQIKLYTNTSIVPPSVCQQTNQANQTIATLTNALSSNIAAQPDLSTLPNTIGQPAVQTPEITASLDEAAKNLQAADAILAGIRK